MNKITKKSVNALMDIYKNHKTNVVLTLTDSDNKDAVLMEIPIKNEMSVDEQGAFVDRVVNACFDSNGDFIPQILDAVFMITLLQMTTNVPVFEKSLTLDDGSTEDVLDIDKTYELCKAINLVSNVKDTSYQQLVQGLRQMVCDKLEYRKQMQFSQERQILTKAREEIENGVAMLVATGQQLMDTLSHVGTAADMSEALKNMNYSELVSTVLSST